MKKYKIDDAEELFDNFYFVCEEWDGSMFTWALWDVSAEHQYIASGQSHSKEDARKVANEIALTYIAEAL